MVESVISGVWNVCGRERWDFQGSQTCSCSQWCFKGSRWRLQLHLWGGSLQTLWRFGGLVRVHRKTKPFTSNFNSILIETVWVYVTQMSFNHPVLRHITMLLEEHHIWSNRFRFLLWQPTLPGSWEENPPVWNSPPPHSPFSHLTSPPN